jgi:hypothetical protein
MSEHTHQPEIKKLTAEQISNARIGKLVIDLDRLAETSGVNVNEALTAFAVISAIKLSEINRPAQVTYERFFAKECKRQRQLQLEKGRVIISDARADVSAAAEGITQEQIADAV